MTRFDWLRWLLWPLEQLYRGVIVVRALAYRRGWQKTHGLPAPVVSIGNLTVGGTGKTPLVLHLARALHARGVRCAVLTRGYGRLDTRPLVLNGLGDTHRFRPEWMGDEPILLAQAAPDVPIGVGADRAETARQVLALTGERPPQVFLLDDGFQHLRVARQLDIVVIDATDPFGGEALLPAGLLRESLGGLSRADIFVLTRVTSPQDRQAIEPRLRRYNTRAPIFAARTEFETAEELKSGRASNLFALKQQPALAFCAIGNPQAFFDDLVRWGFTLAGRRAFPDHHRYTERDIDSLAKQARDAGARVLVTTEKDRVNLKGAPLPATADLPVFVCRVKLEMEDEGAFLSRVLSVVAGEGR